MSPAKPADHQPGHDNAELPAAELPAAELPERVAELAGELAEARSESRRRRLARQIPELATRGGRATRRRIRSGGSAAMRTARTSGQWLSGQVLEMAPKVPMRSRATLAAQYPGLDTEQLAAALITSAARASAGVGAAVGAAAAVPFVPAASVEVVVETMALIAIELKLIAELHEVYGVPAPGSAAQRMMAYVGSWADRRGVRISAGGLVLAVGSPLRRKLERRVLAKASRSTLALAPLLTGAAAAALLNHHETRKLGSLIRADLRKLAPTPGAVDLSPDPPPLQHG